MSRARPLHARAARSCAAVLAVGIALTSVAFMVVRGDVDRLTRQGIDRPAGQALLGVQHLTAAVDQVLATANGVYATSGGDPVRFAAVLGPDVEASPTIAGLALVAAGTGGVRRSATVGTTRLLDGRERAALAATTSSTLLATRRDRGGFNLGFAARVAHGSAAVYLEVRLPLTKSATLPFALVRNDGARGAGMQRTGATHEGSVSGAGTWGRRT